MNDTNDKPIFQLCYTLAREDIAAYEFLPHELQGAQKLWLWLPILACGAIAGFFEDRLRLILPWDPTTRWGQLGIVVLAIIAGYGLAVILLTARTRRRIAKSPLPSTPTRIDVYPQLFFVREDGDERSYLWSEAVIVDTPQHVFIIHGSRKPVIVPLRAFKSLEDVQDFAGMARAWCNASDIANDGAGESEEVKS